MKRPQAPPQMEELPTLSPERLAEVVDLVAAMEPRDRYFHWDDLRFRTPPRGISRHEWWLALKLSRRSQATAIPLRDLGGRPFRFVSTGYIQSVERRIESLAGGKLKLPDAITSPRTRSRYATASLMEEAITSSQLEGAAVTRRDAKRMLQSGRKPRHLGERMIHNNFAVMRALQEFQETPLSPELILEIHRLISKGTLGDAGAEGRYRNESERIAVVDALSGEVAHLPPPADELASRVEALCKFANEAPGASSSMSPLVRAIALHFWLAYDHPFVDGNGRTARALFYWYLLRNGYGLFRFISISSVLRKAPAKYGRAYMLTETDDNDLTYFIHFNFEVIEKALDELFAYVVEQASDVKAVEECIGDRVAFNRRQKDLLGHALKNPDAHYTFRSHQDSHGSSRQTARTDLLGLVAAGLLVQRKEGRQLLFTPAKDMEGRLAAPGDEGG